LASDLDGTIIPLDREERFEQDLQAFRACLARVPFLLLAYITGRDLALALKGIAEYQLPAPNLLVTDVGTTIYARREEEWAVDTDYREEMRARMGGKTGEEAALALEAVPELTLQEADRQAEFKKSFYAPPDHHPDALLTQIRRRLDQAGFQVNLVWSVDEKQGKGLLDILPEGVAKDYALHYLQRHLEVPREAVVYAGDSGNDLPAFTSGFNAVVVGNTPEPVKRLVRDRARRKKVTEAVFFARHPCVKGVTEGCRHFKIFPAGD
jgi:HAD superfamily hydrolase (TIGR01484 family)